MRKGSMERIYVGEMYDPNDLALIMVTFLPLAFFLYSTEKNIMKKLFSLTTIGLSIITIILTKSRGAFIGIISIAVLFILIKTNPNKSRLNFRKILILFLCTLVFVYYG